MRRFLVVLLAVVAGLAVACGSKEVKLKDENLTKEERAQRSQFEQQFMQQNQQMVQQMDPGAGDAGAGQTGAGGGQ